MNGTDPWITDLRRSGYQQAVSRTGLPAVPQYTLRSFRLFVGKIWVTFLLAVATVSVLYCGKILRSPTMNIKPKADQQLYLHEEDNSKFDLLVISEHLEAHVLLGGIFANNFDVFYSIHPLAPILDECNELSGSTKANYLYSNYKCSFRNQSRLFTDVGLSTDPNSHSSPLKECLTNNFCFRKENLRFCTGSLCRMQTSETCETCGPVDVLLAASQYCRKAKIRAIGIGLNSCDYDCLQKLTREQDINVKIVFIHCQECIREQKVCPNQLKTYADPLDAFEYLSLRLEDLRRNPSSITNEICDYAGHTSLCHSSDSFNKILKRRRKRRDVVKSKRKRN